MSHRTDPPRRASKTLGTLAGVAIGMILISVVIILLLTELEVI